MSPTPTSQRAQLLRAPATARLSGRTRGGMVALMVGLGLGLAIALGVSASLFGAGRLLLLGALLLPLPLIARDYRVGVVALSVLLPVAPMLPPLRGLNLINDLTAVTLLAYALQAGFARGRPGGTDTLASLATATPVRLPRAIWALVLPASWAMLIAWPHIPEGVRNYPALPAVREVFEPTSYLVARYLKPLGQYLAFAFLLANAVRTSRRPERFFLALGAGALLAALAVFYSVLSYPGSFADVARDREFMAPRGMHANEFGMLLALAAVPLLFIADGATTLRTRALAWASWGVVTLAMLLTFSRGALVAELIGIGAFLLQHRRVKTLLFSLALAALVTLAAPAALQERLGTGLRADAIQDASDVERDDLTAGRVHGWLLLAPEVLNSPWFGSGLGSTQWSDAVATGRYHANHPHNIYLELLMDLGLLGFGAMAWLHGHYLRQMGRLARDEALSPLLRSYFRGARSALLGMLAMAATTAYYMPNSAQAPFWFSLGFLFAYAPARSRAVAWSPPRPTPRPARISVPTAPITDPSNRP